MKNGWVEAQGSMHDFKQFHSIIRQIVKELENEQRNGGNGGVGKALTEHH